MAPLVETFEKMLTENLEAELEAQGITDAGIRVRPGRGGMSGMGGLGAYLKPWWSASISRKIEKKSEAKEREAWVLVSRFKDLAKSLKAKEAAGEPREVVREEMVKTANAAEAAAREADAPIVTKKEIIESLRPTITKAAEEMAAGVTSSGRKVGQMMFKTVQADVPFFAHPELEWDFPGMGQAGAESMRYPDWFPTHPVTDWDFRYKAQKYSPAARGSIL